MPDGVSSLWVTVGTWKSILLRSVRIVQLLSCVLFGCCFKCILPLIQSRQTGGRLFVISVVWMPHLEINLQTTCILDLVQELFFTDFKHMHAQNVPKWRFWHKFVSKLFLCAHIDAKMQCYKFVCQVLSYKINITVMYYPPLHVYYVITAFVFFLFHFFLSCLSVFNLLRLSSVPVSVFTGADQFKLWL